MDIALAADDDALALAVLEGGRPGPVERLRGPAAPARVAELERLGPRWVWADTTALHPPLLAAGVAVGRAQDLRLGHAVLARSRYLDVPLAGADDERWRPVDPVSTGGEPSLLDLTAADGAPDLAEVVAEHARQQEAVEASARRDRLRLLLAAESAGALVAAELTAVGLPFDEAEHDALLTRVLGPRPLPGGRPARLEALAGEVRTLLRAPGLNPDSGPDLLRALHTQGLTVDSTRQWELERLDHPVVAPLLEYKKLARLLSANGWSWLAAWVRDGRFRPEYLPAGVVTGRWAARGGGALQLPKQVRAAVVAAPGRRLVVADAAQLEPRVLAAMARDEAMARASRAGDLYQALVDEHVVDTRAHAKVAMLGALYGATSGEAGQLMPRLLRSYPRATGHVEEAARAGERGEVVTTWLGRSSPPPPESWHRVQQRASLPEATPADQRRARSQARDQGRFTRNFVVQGTAAEWALCWLADLRRRLRALEPVDGVRPALVYFLHDEVIVETPEALAGAVEEAVRAAARRAGELLFGRFPVEFALDVQCVQSYAEAG
ncbi:bifunctional 3'-5' exonuclease/DNA polymerase [Microlunatus capsulatus]|uniref:DNA-directed DNA polymerase n=1 Tax=Microlunatus capsulatus TaxID=99117 RepID=A0ABS4Z4B1_9ACTN|nr:bifunctional 3'-5' exonuclease/DNA polymerase [Microlunatus capsulatus]MBP2415542.1 DNA polymerase-1 [Microlunatus capsulatus]